MSMWKDRKPWETVFYSAAGVAAMAVLLVAVNFAAQWSHVRLDLTEGRVHTLSQGTRSVLKGMDTDVTVRLYVSRSSAQMPVDLKAFAGRVEDMLNEYKALANGGHFKVQVLDPAPDSDAESSAELDGVPGQPLMNGDAVYCGLSMRCLDQVSTVGFLSPQREGLLEYDLTTALYRVLHPEKPKVGVMSSMPVLGRMNPMFMQMGSRGGTPPWVFFSEIKRDYTLQEIPVSAREIPADVKILLLVHPKNLSDETLYAIDQFVLRGGRVLAFLDPMSWVDARMGAADSMGMMGGATPPGPSTLGKLLAAWGVTFDTEKVVADLQTMTKVGGASGQPEDAPAILSLTAEQCNPDDPASAQIESVVMAFAGSFGGDGADKLQRTVLLSSSPKSALVDGYMAQMGAANVLRTFKSDNQKKTLALRLTGTFKTAFPGGSPAPAPGKKQGGGTEGAAPSGTPAAGEPAKNESLKASAAPGMVILVGDSDMLYDQLAVQVQSVLGQRFLSPINDNFAFAQNLLDQLSGDPVLISIRSRGAVRRPFTVINRMQAEAEEAGRAEIDRYEKTLEELAAKLEELQARKGGKDQKMILSPDQQKAREDATRERVAAQAKLKELRKALRRDLERLETGLKWLNIALMPVVVGVVGLVVGLARKRRTK